MSVPVLPDGPRAGRVAQAVAFHRDPLGFLRAQQARHGDVFAPRRARSRRAGLRAGGVRGSALGDR
jgi:hypothetical protein